MSEVLGYTSPTALRGSKVVSLHTDQPISTMPAPAAPACGNGERRSPFPIRSLTAVEREALRGMSRALEVAKGRIDEAVQTGRVDHAIGALTSIDRLGDAAAQTVDRLQPKPGH